MSLISSTYTTNAEIAWVILGYFRFGWLHFGYTIIIDSTSKSSAKFDINFLLDKIKPELLDTVRFKHSV